MPTHIQVQIIQVLSDVREVYSSCCGSNLDPNHKAVTRNFKNSWQSLFDEPQIKLSWTPKAHIIAEHFSDYFEDPLVCGQSLGVTTDQVIEHMHSYLNKMLTKSQYKLKDVHSKLGTERQHKGIVKLNSFAVKIQ